MNIAKFLRAAFFIEHLRWLLLQMFCFTLYFQKEVAEYIVVYCFILKPKITLIRFNSLLFVVPLFGVICRSTRCHSLSIVITRCTTRCDLLYYSLSLVVPLNVNRCATRCHSLPLDVTSVCLFINDQNI